MGLIDTRMPTTIDGKITLLFWIPIEAKDLIVLH